uniref:Uncharacterized protein n=1 Tax=Mycena chlorophos TaxID=658473 RepID=A0ABQ0MAT7_MYCCL|nr:predicted protein [Mycena chlorophos]
MAAQPPTQNALPKTHRVRLMRSTRKLAALLGAAPLLVDTREAVPPLPSPSPRPNSPTGDQVPQTPTIDAVLAKHAGPVLEPVESSTRPTLLLRINTLPGTRPRSASQTLGRPSSMALTPTSDSLLDGEDGQLEKKQRWRKMAHVARILGNGVPIELVFPDRDEDVPSPESRPPTRLEQAKVVSLDEDEPCTIMLPALKAVKSVNSSPSSPARASTSSEQPMMVERPAGARIRRASSMQFTSKDKNALLQPRNELVRKEINWTGEWNQDKDAVMKGLRTLKA